MISASPRPILVFSSQHNIMSNDTIVNNFIMFNSTEFINCFVKKTYFSCLATVTSNGDQSFTLARLFAIVSKVMLTGP